MRGESAPPNTLPSLHPPSNPCNTLQTTPLPVSRFLGVRLGRDNNITTGKVYRKVIARERRGDYLGKTVQVVPHITNEIQDWIERVAHEPVSDDGDGVADVCLIELGGTVGDIESMVFLEALRQFQFRVGDENFMLMFVSLVPVLGAVGEQKTKPTQHGVKELRSLGLSPKVIFCRSSTPLEADTVRACESRGEQEERRNELGTPARFNKKRHHEP